MEFNKKHIIIYGPTASGKTDLSFKIAKKLESISLVNSDSRQTLDYLPSLTMIPQDIQYTNYLFGINSISDAVYTAGDFIQDIIKINKIDTNQKIIVGGSGFYILCLLNGMAPKKIIDEEIVSLVEKQPMDKNFNLLTELDPNHNLHPNDHYRIKNYLSYFLQNKHSIKDVLTEPVFKSNEVFTIFLNPSKEMLIQNIEIRIKLYFDKMVEEVIDFNKKYKNQTLKTPIIGYKEITDYINNKLSKEKTEEMIIIKTRQYGKTQRTFMKNKLKSDLTIDENYNINDILERVMCKR